MTHSYSIQPIHMWHDSFIIDMTPSFVERLIHLWKRTCPYWLAALRPVHVWHGSFICDMAHSYVTWLIHMWHDFFMCGMRHSYVKTMGSVLTGCTSACTCVTWLMHKWYDSFIRNMTRLYVTWLFHTCKETSIFHNGQVHVDCLHFDLYMCYMTQSYAAPIK